MKTCKNCGGTERYKSGACKPCNNQNAVAWRLANPEKHRASVRKWRAANLQKARAATAKWAAENREKLKEDLASWRAANADWIREYSAIYASEHPETVRTNARNRRAKKRGAGGKLSTGLAEKLFKLQRGKCACGCKQPLGNDFHRDHIMPLDLGGPNIDSNIQLLRARCNLQKRAKHPVDFMQTRGFLL